MSNTIHFEGYAALFNTPTQIRSPHVYTESLDPDAFTRSLRNPKLDVLMKINHAGLPIARTTARTLRLSTDSTGLRVDADLDRRVSTVADLAVMYERGDLDGQMSFAFKVPTGGEVWNNDYSARRVNVADIDHGDVSIVNHGAYPMTSSTMRGGSFTLEERRAAAQLTGGVGWSTGPIIAIDGHEVRTSMTWPHPSPDAVDPLPELRDAIDAWYEHRREFTAAQRKKLAAAGLALPDGSFPIVTVEDLENAIRDIGRASDTGVAKAHIIKRAKMLGRTDLLPADWQVSARAQLPPNDSDALRLEASLAAFRGEDRAAADALAGDRARTPAHLLDTALTNLAHARQHADRLGDPDVIGSPRSIAHNREHLLTHLQSAQDHVRRLGHHLEAHATDPALFKSERDRITSQRSLPVNDSAYLRRDLAAVDAALVPRTKLPPNDGALLRDELRRVS